MCIEIKNTFVTEEDMVVYGVFRQAEDEGFASPFAHHPLTVGRQLAEKSDSSDLADVRVGFHCFRTIETARVYADIFKPIFTIIFKSIIPAETVVSEGEINGTFYGGGLLALLTPVIVQTDKIMK